MKKPSKSDTKSIESNELAIVKQYIQPNKKNLVVFDIDNTLATVPDDLATPEWFIWQLQAYEKKGLSSSEALNKALHLHNHLLNHTWLHAAPNASQVIQHLHKKGVATIALTARNLVNRTLEQLAAAGITLQNASLPQDFFWLPTNNSQRPGAGYKQGVVFCNGNDKGSLLLHFLQQTAYQPDTIIFVDDMQEHVHAVKKVITKHNLPCVGIRYSYFDKKAHNFNPQRAHQQLQTFLHKHPVGQGPIPYLAHTLCM